MVGTGPALQPIASKDAKDGFNFLLKGIIVGDACVGKTALIQRFTADIFNSDYIQTIGIDFAIKVFRSSDGDYIKVQLWDTAGSERFRTITNSYYRGSHGVMIVFDIGNEESFDTVEEKMREVQIYTAEDTPIIMVGNKSDIEDKRKVSREKAENFAKENGMQYIETTAKENNYVDFAFQAFVEAMITLQKKRRAEVKEKPMTKTLDKKIKKNQPATSGKTSAETKSMGQTKSSTCTII